MYNASNGTSLNDVKWKSPLLGVLLSLFCLVTVLGNMLVLVSIKRERHLKSTSNMYIASLAVADLVVGLVVMPTATIHEMADNVWFFGQVYCDLWHSMDIFASTASINSLLIIGLDRYAAISDPIKYHTKWLTRYWFVYVVALWIGSALISFPAIAYWRLAITKNSVSAGPADRTCEFTDDFYYLVFSSSVSFYIPLTVMIAVYARIYWKATRQIKSHSTGQKRVDKSSDALQLRIHRGRYSSLSPNPSAARITNPSFVRLRDTPRLKLMKRFRKFSRDQKAAKTLGILMGVFIFCWVSF
jgi:dopamine D1-like receptor